ncbi:MAG: gliding motility-associated lipoprotein, partial [Chitinophagaceae bacterium]
MNNRILYLLAVTAIVTSASSCKMLSGKKKSGSLPNDGQLHGVAPAARWNMPKPVGMVYVPPGTFHMGPSDEDVNYAYTARNKQVSISGFWMDATEVTNNEYRQFTNWVRDSIAAKLMGFVKTSPDGAELVDWTKVK